MYTDARVCTFPLCFDTPSLELQLAATYDSATNDVHVKVPPTRTDILHACDVIEDVAIAFGYNNIPRTLPKTSTVGTELPINKLSDDLRHELAQAGYTECLTMALLARVENFDLLRRPDDNSAVELLNPKTQEFQIARTSLLPGVLKTLQSNRDVSVKEGLKLFEISDIMHKDTSSDVGASNRRDLAAVYMGLTSGFEVIHGLVDRVMQLLEVRPRDKVVADEMGSMGGADGARDNGWRYWIEAVENDTFFPGRCAVLKVSRPATSDAPAEENIQAGIFGTLHPQVLQNFELSFPASAMELNLELFL